MGDGMLVVSFVSFLEVADAVKLPDHVTYLQSWTRIVYWCTSDRLERALVWQNYSTWNEGVCLCQQISQFMFFSRYDC